MPVSSSHNGTNGLGGRSSSRRPLLRERSDENRTVKEIHSSGSIQQLPKDTRRRTKSFTQVLANNLHNNQYMAQEKNYLRKIRNLSADDYYNKGIKENQSSVEDSVDEDIDDEDERLSSYANSDLFADSDDDKYAIDYALTFDIMQSWNSKLTLDESAKTISKDTIEDPMVLERLEWQAMLLSVLTGDVVRSEKTKIIENSNSGRGKDGILESSYREDLWFGIRAKLYGRSADDQRKIVVYRRSLVDNVIEDLLKYEVSYEPGALSPRDQVARVIESYDKICELWPTPEAMKLDKPACATLAFQDRIDALTAWLTITDAIGRQLELFKKWIGNDSLDITQVAQVSELPMNEEQKQGLTDTKINRVKQIYEEDNKSLAERVMLEKDVQTAFWKRIYSPLAPWVVKSKETYILLGHMFETMKLPDYGQEVIDLCLVPVRLIREIISMRMGYAEKLQNPTLMMIDQMLEDFKSYITIAMEVKNGIMEFCEPDADKTWVIRGLFEKDLEEFDLAVLKCVGYYLTLLNKKLLDGSKTPFTFRTNKEPDTLEAAFEFLKNIGQFIDGGGALVAVSVVNITSRLCLRLLSYLNHSLRNPQPSSQASLDLIRWYNSTTENFGQLRRKLARFSSEISRTFTNSLLFEVIQGSTNVQTFLECLENTGHFLVYTGSVEADGMYFFASPSLLNQDAEIIRIIKCHSVGSSGDYWNHHSRLRNMIHDGFLRDDIRYSAEAHLDDADYVVAFCPLKAIVWEGPLVNIKIDDVPITDLKSEQLMLISKAPYFDLPQIRDRFMSQFTRAALGNDVLKLLELRSSITKVHLELKRINKLFFRTTLAILDSTKIIIENCRLLLPMGGYQDFVNSFFVYARDYGKSSVKWSESAKKPVIIMRLIQLSISWVSFVCDDCIPTDRKTFRWCVLALEFALEMTKGFNVLVLDEDSFYMLKLKVARCMSLLISHFDIMGARSSEAEKKRILKWTSQRQSIENMADDEAILQAHHDEMMERIQDLETFRNEVEVSLNSVGHVLDVSDLEYLFVTLLASSFSSVSIRWQKGRFIGGGSFGQVFAAVNLDTGGVMAVKEIVFHDSQSLELIPSIKEEMTVLEMLNHPNVVQYFGVEVHRDKVYIFMEFCESGSLAGLLSHGRIEDEMFVQVYTLQMLEGLAYLHQSGVVHRDIKPENILLDHNGVIKFVDFGAAKVIAAQGRTKRGLTHHVTTPGSDDGSSPQNINSMTGTPMYMSPEAITGQKNSKSWAVDIWSLGCCVLEMATGKRPWANLDNEWAIMYHIAAGHKPALPGPDQMSEGGRKFVARCLEHDPGQRPSAAELLNDPWINQIRQAAFGSSDSGSTPISESSTLTLDI